MLELIDELRIIYKSMLELIDELSFKNCFSLKTIEIPACVKNEVFKKFNFQKIQN